MMRFAVALYAVLLVLFLFFPILVVAPISFSADRFMRFPPDGYGFRWYAEFFQNPVWIDATLRSLRVGALASLTASLCGTLLVLWVERVRPRLGAPVTTLALAPAIVPNVVIALGVFLIAVFARANDTEAALVLAHAVLGLPFVVLIVGAGVRQIDPTLERAARVMGAGPVRAFFVGTFPSLAPAIVSGALFAFFVSLDELIVALFMMGTNITLPMRIWADLRFELNPTIAAASMLFVVFTTLGMTLAEVLRRRSAR